LYTKWFLYITLGHPWVSVHAMVSHYIPPFRNCEDYWGATLIEWLSSSLGHNWSKNGKRTWWAVIYERIDMNIKMWIGVKWRILCRLIKVDIASAFIKGNHKTVLCIRFSLPLRRASIKVYCSFIRNRILFVMESLLFISLPSLVPKAGGTSRCGLFTRQYQRNG
jgi:hypothetical protein